MQPTIEQLVESERFSMPALLARVLPLIEAHPQIAALVPPIRGRLGGAYPKLAAALLRHVFLIELVKVPKIETTKFRVRWFSELENDPRGCSFAECVDIARDLLADLPGWLADPQNAELLAHCFVYSLLPYEAPLDYRDRPASSDRTTRIHRRGNLCWTNTDTMLRTMKLRKFLTDPSTSPDADFFSAVLKDKITVKTYLTDRVLTGDHKTNREKRWEVHPASVHFADRRTCLAIEYVLVTQLCGFEGFPDRSRQVLQDAGILPRELPVFRCPVTQDPMSFEAFHKELRDPTAGKSSFHVGHLNPLKLDGNDGATGHTAENIGWISADGNRIQGSLSLAEARQLLRRVATNYEGRGWD